MCSGKPIFEKSYIIAEVSETLADDIISWCYDHVQESDIYYDSEDHSFGREEYVHLTILGCIEDTEKNVSETISSCKNTSCQLGKIKLFTQNSKFDVLMIEVVDDEILNLNKQLFKNIINKPDFPKYIPHITIAYLKKGCGKEFVENQHFCGRTFPIDALVYSIKTGQKNKYQLGKT
jgi:2'-5' RNA ligase